MAFFPSEGSGPHIDPLLVSQLRAPMLTELLNSPHMKAEMGAVANQIKELYLAKYQAVARQTGNLGSTAKVTYHRNTHAHDRRWEAEFSVGGPKAPYAVQLEEEHHLLAQALRDLGYPVGDIRRVAPPGQG